MSTFACEVIEVRGWGPHPDADRLSITEAFGNPVIIAKDSFERGQKAVYIPVDALVDVTRPEFAFLKQKDGRQFERVKAKRIRGFYSEGLLVPADPAWQVGFDAKEALGVQKWEEPTSLDAGENERDPGFMPVFGLEPYLKFKGLLEEGERVIVTEKIHGCNSRFGVKEGQFFVGSHHMIKRFDPDNTFWQLAIRHSLEEKLRALGRNKLCVYGEIFGQVQDLKYGRAPGVKDLALFAAYEDGRWLDYDEFVEVAKALDVPTVPVLYDGPYSHDVVFALRLGKTTFGGDHIREGVVVTPAKERLDRRHGRVSLKAVSEEYKLRKGGTEHK